MIYLLFFLHKKVIITQTTYKIEILQLYTNNKNIRL